MVKIWVVRGKWVSEDGTTYTQYMTLASLFQQTHLVGLKHIFCILHIPIDVVRRETSLVDFSKTAACTYEAVNTYVISRTAEQFGRFITVHVAGSPKPH